MININNTVVVFEGQSKDGAFFTRVEYLQSIVSLSLSLDHLSLARIGAFVFGLALWVHGGVFSASAARS